MKFHRSFTTPLKTARSRIAPYVGKTTGNYYLHYHNHHFQNIGNNNEEGGQYSRHSHTPTHRQKNNKQQRPRTLSSNGQARHTYRPGQTDKHADRQGPTTSPTCRMSTGAEQRKPDGHNHRQPVTCTPSPRHGAAHFTNTYRYPSVHAGSDATI